MYKEKIEKHQNLINDFINDDGVLFLGAGISKSAQLPIWDELIKPLASKLGIEYDSKDILLIPQYYIQQNAQGRRLLNQYLIDKFKDSCVSFSVLHQLIINIPTKWIITTNYDELVEKTYKDENIEFNKVVCDNDLAYLNSKLLTIIKMNGCISDPNSCIISRDDFFNYKDNHPEIINKIKNLMQNKTFLFIGFSFRDPIYQEIYHNTLKNFKHDRKPFYFISLKSNKYEIEDMRLKGIEVLDLEAHNTNDQVEISKLLEEFIQIIRENKSTNSNGKSSYKKNNNYNLSKLLPTRLGTGLSLVIEKEHIDLNHIYKLLYRQDMLDYSVGDFFSIRRLKGINASNQLSSFLIYSESSEQKVSFFETQVKAYDYNTNQELIVESFETQNKKLFTHAFRIYFRKPLAPNEKFDIIYKIKLPGELNVLSSVNEIMSISLARISKSIDKLIFNVCLNFMPRSYFIETKNLNGESHPFTGKKPKCSKYIPKNKYEKFFNIDWSSQPYRISWECESPDKLLYIIHYMR